MSNWLAVAIEARLSHTC